MVIIDAPTDTRFDVTFKSEKNISFEPKETPMSPEILERKEAFVGEAIKQHTFHREQKWGAINDVKIAVGEVEVAPSYHDEKHVRAVVLASTEIIEAAKRGNDPLGILSDLSKYNATNKTALTIDDLSLAYSVAMAGHDLGNITKTSEAGLDAAGNIILDYAERYQGAPGPPEARSGALTEYLIKHYFHDLPDDQAARIESIKPLVQEIIRQTEYRGQKADRATPFDITTKFIDQIAQYHFSEKSLIENVAGFINEKGWSVYMDRNMSGDQKEVAFPMSPRDSLLFSETSIYRLIGVPFGGEPTEAQQEEANEIMNMLSIYAKIKGRDLVPEFEYIHDKLNAITDPNDILLQKIDWDNYYAGQNGANVATKRVMELSRWN